MSFKQIQHNWFPVLCFQNLDQPKLTVKDVKDLIQDQQPPPQPAIEYPVRTDPEPKFRSPGKGKIAPTTGGPFTCMIRAWISYHTHEFIWDVIMHPC